MFDAVVIGGGISGLVATYRLIKRGLNAILLEEGQPGGVIRTVHVEGAVLECGPNVLMEKEELGALINELGLRSEVVYPAVRRYRQYVWHAKAKHIVPKTPLRLLKTPLISRAGKKSLFSKIVFGKSFVPQAADESVATFVGRLVGQEAVSALLDPALKGIYGGDVRSLSARSIFKDLWIHASAGNSLFSYIKSKKRSEILVLRNGMVSLIEALKSKIPAAALLPGKVSELSNQGPEQFVVKTADGRLLQAAKIYIATSGQRTGSYIEKLDPGLAQLLGNMRYAALVVVHVIVPDQKTVEPDCFGVLFPSNDDRLLGIMYNSILFPHLAPKGKQLLTICFGGVESEALLSASDPEIGQRALKELKSKLQIEQGQILLVTRWPRAIPQYELGHYQLVAQMRALEKRLPGLNFIGVDAGGVGVADRVRMAFTI